MSRKWYEVLRDRRLELGLNPGELARAVGLSRPAILKIESGETRYPRYETVVALSAYLGLDPVAVFAEATGGAGEGDAAGDEERGRGTAQWERDEQEMLRVLADKFGRERAVDILYRLYQLDPDDLDAIRGMIDRLNARRPPSARRGRDRSQEA